MTNMLPFAALVEINPRVKLEKDKEYPFIEMGVVDPGRRYVQAAENRHFKGGGTKFMAGDTLFARITPCLENGKIAQFHAINNAEAFGSTEFFIFRARPSISDPAYVYYLAKTDLIRKPAEKSMSGASGRQRADLKSITDLEVPAPPLPTQHKIASILSAYDDLIENNLRRVRILEEMAQNLYREWFVKFLFPGHEKVKMVDSGGDLGMIPQGWQNVHFGELYKTSSGGTPSRKVPEYYGGSILWVKTRELNDRFILNTAEKITEVGLKKSSARIYPEHTVLIALYGATIGKLGILAHPACTNQACCAIHPIDDVFSNIFAFCTLYENRGKLINLGMGAAQQNISQVIIKGFPVLKPDAHVVRVFSELMTPVFNMIMVLQMKNVVLRQCRDLLLPRLISGELDVSELDITVEENIS